MRRPCLNLTFALILTALSGCNAARPIETVRTSGQNLYKQGQYEAARDDFAEIVSRHPGDWQAQYMLGLCLIDTDELSGARRALEVAYTLKPNEPKVVNALAEVMFLQEDEERLYSFLRERASTTQSVAAYIRLSQYARELSDPDTAKRAIQTAMKIDRGETTEPYLEAALLAEHLGDLDEAVRRLRQAYGINPDDWRVKQRLDLLGVNMAQVNALPPEW